jgi:hypothetical protein
VRLSIKKEVEQFIDQHQSISLTYGKIFRGVSE